MKIGVFDSGLGGLFTMSAVSKVLSEYDYVYLGDTKRLPYGARSHEAIYEFLKEGVDFLFAQNCALVIVACNTASAEALRELQQKYIPKKYPGRNVLGMIVPMTEASAEFKRVGLVATSATVSSGAYEREFKKRAKKSKIFPLATPLLVPFIESGDVAHMRPVLTDYLKHFQKIGLFKTDAVRGASEARDQGVVSYSAGTNERSNKEMRRFKKPDTKKNDALLLGCTHYGIVKNEFKKLLPKGVVILSQDTVVPKKTKEYLSRHPEIASQLSRKGTRAFYVTDITPTLQKLANKWFGKEIKIQKVSIEK